MKPTCHREAGLGYDFADLHSNASIITARDAWWSQTKPWRVKSRGSAKFLQRMASKARRQASKQGIAQAILD